VGKHQVDVGHAVGLATSGIRMMIQKSEKIRISAKSTAVLTAAELTHSRNNLLDKMKRLLSIWIEKHNQHHIPLCQLIILQRTEKNLFLNSGAEESINNQHIWRLL
jgi:hypothetical protein